MSLDSGHIEEASHPSRNGAVGMRFVVMSGRCCGNSLSLRGLWWVLFFATHAAWSSVAAHAAFMVPSTSAAVASSSENLDSLDSFVSISFVLLAADQSLDKQLGISEGGGGAGTGPELTSDSPESPAWPFDNMPSEVGFAGAVAFGGPVRGSTSAPVTSGGGSSGAAGIFNGPFKLSGLQLVEWLIFEELLRFPPGPPSELFRPPPIFAIQSCV